jgi:hypothetical protein
LRHHPRALLLLLLLLLLLGLLAYQARFLLLLLLLLRVEHSRLGISCRAHLLSVPRLRLPASLLLLLLLLLLLHPHLLLLHPHLLLLLHAWWHLLLLPRLNLIFKGGVRGLVRLEGRCAVREVARRGWGEEERGFCRQERDTGSKGDSKAQTRKTHHPRSHWPSLGILD